MAFNINWRDIQRKYVVNNADNYLIAFIQCHQLNTITHTLYERESYTCIH